ncbi:MAG: hypothetical protein KKE08_18760 [Gammaproteobacteria bacterium]|nr:hypothetical protein [Gammaproteobacteria bacterium]MBU2185070.1 hypothetical protein [Gammaproteobacteria bacterium]MBU2206938.1 hypothetical protein [Gammaproteobacteria bacterium]
MWIRDEGVLRDSKTALTVAPKSFGQPIYFENLGELYFTGADVVLKMSAQEFDQFYQEYENALQH